MDRGLRYGEHFQSLNSLYVLWAWQYIGEIWLAANPQKAVQG